MAFPKNLATRHMSGLRALHLRILPRADSARKGPPQMLSASLRLKESH